MRPSRLVATQVLSAARVNAASLHPWACDDALSCPGVVGELAQEPSSVLCSALLSAQAVPPVRNRTWITVFTGLGFSPPTR